MFLSIVIPVYNVEKYIAECLQSCLQIIKYYNDYEIIIIDDGTEDNSIFIVEGLVESFSNVKIYHKHNGGLSSARNYGLEKSVGKYVWFIDSDDKIDPRQIKNIVKDLKKYKPDIFKLQYKEFLDDGTILYNNKYNSVAGTAVLKTGRDLLRDTKKNFGVPFYIFKKEFMKKNSLYFQEGIYHEDIEFSPRAMFFASTVFYYNDYCYYYRVRRAGSIMNNLKLKNGVDMINIANNLNVFYRLNNIRGIDRIVFKRIISGAIRHVYRVANRLTDNREKKILIEALRDNKLLVVENMFGAASLKYFIIGIFTFFSPYLGAAIYQLIASLKTDL